MKLYEKRYSERVYDTNKQIEDNLLKEVLNWGVFAPSSLGFEAWQFVVVKNQDIKDQLFQHSFGQQQVKDAPAVIILLSRKASTFNTESKWLAKIANRRKDKTDEQIKKYIEDTVNQMTYSLQTESAIDAWLSKQTYIAAGQIAIGATDNGLSTVIMEGFNPNGVSEVLSENKIANMDEFNVNTMIPIGYAKDEYDYSKKTRFDFDEIVNIVK